MIRFDVMSHSFVILRIVALLFKYEWQRRVPSDSALGWWDTLPETRLAGPSRLLRRNCEIVRSLMHTRSFYFAESFTGSTISGVLELKREVGVYK